MKKILICLSFFSSISSMQNASQSVPDYFDRLPTDIIALILKNLITPFDLKVAGESPQEFIKIPGWHSSDARKFLKLRKKYYESVPLAGAIFAALENDNSSFGKKLGLSVCLATRGCMAWLKEEFKKKDMADHAYNFIKFSCAAKNPLPVAPFSTSRVKMLLKVGFPINSYYNGEGVPLLIEALQRLPKDHSDIYKLGSDKENLSYIQRITWITLLVAYGADPNICTQQGTSALLCLVQDRNSLLWSPKNAIKMLLELGAKPIIKGQFIKGKTEDDRAQDEQEYSNAIEDAAYLAGLCEQFAKKNEQQNAIARELANKGSPLSKIWQKQP
jgi:hypothetical protein